MMILRSSPASPFGRKVKICASILGLSDAIDIVATDTTDPADTIRAQNPLGKIPALILDDGDVLFDSRVIVEFLDSMAGGGRLIPTEPKRRFAILTQVALADGIMDASILQVYEQRYRDPGKREPKWLTLQAEKVRRALDDFARTPPHGADRTAADVGLACALGYLDLRFEGLWRTSHPSLVAWLDAFAADIPAFERTRVKPA